MYTAFTTGSDALANRKWFVVDLAGQTLGRAATRIAHVLRGKHKATFTPHIDDGDFVVVINADKVTLTGRKWKQKTYYNYSGYPGGLKQATAEKVLAKRPEDILRLAVKGMLPRGPLGRAQITKLKIYAAPEHPHQAQQPVALDLATLLAKSA